MDSLIIITFWTFLLSLLTEPAAAGTYCTKYSYTQHTTTLFYCSTSCCGTATTRYCCRFSLGISLISGIIIASLIGFGIIVAVICTCVKKHGMRSRAVQPGRIKITVLHTDTNTQQPQRYNNGYNRLTQSSYNAGSVSTYPPSATQPIFHTTTQFGLATPALFSNNNPPTPAQNGYEVSNPTGKVLPAYPPTYPADVAPPYPGNDVPPPYTYINPVFSPAVQGNTSISISHENAS